MLRGQTLMIVPDHLIVQSWRASSWKKNDPDSVLILQFDRVKNGGRITLLQANVPQHAYRNIKEGRPKHYIIGRRGKHISRIAVHDNKEIPMQRMIGLFALSMLLVGLSGCSYLFYPRAGDYATQAKGASGVETMINLTTMMEATAAKAKGGKGVDTAFDDLHNQFHALRDAYCGVTEAQAKTPAYDLAVTHKKELTAIFWRLWKFKDDQPQRDLHLDLLSVELKELRETLQTIQ